jgi:hypothetical protein
MTLLSRKRFGSPLLAEEGEGGGKLMLDSVFRMELPSRYRRDALCVDIAAPAAPGAVLRLLNVHLDSLDSHFRRVLQMQVLAASCASPDPAVGSSQVTSTQSCPRIIGSSTSTSCSMPGSRYTGVRGLMEELRGVSASD